MNKRIVVAVIVLGGAFLVASVITKGNLVLTALSVMCLGIALTLRLHAAKKMNRSITIASMDQMRRDMKTMMSDVPVSNKSPANVS